MRSTCSPMTSLFALGLALSCALASSSAHADPNPNEQVAQTLFDAARAHLAQGEVARACAELEQSYMLDAAGGTLLNLAFCYERQGRLGTALDEYQRALAQAKRDNRVDRVKTATDRIADLETRAPNWTIIAPPGNYDALAITIDGAPFPSDKIGQEAHVDPGAHVIRVTANGRIARSVKVVARESVRERIPIPALESDGTAAAPVGAPLTALPPSVNIEPAINPVPPSSTPTAAPVDPGTQESSFGTVHYAFFISSGALLVAGSIFGGVALNYSSQVSGQCIKSRDFCPNDSAESAVSSMRGYAIASTVALSAGVVAGITGLVWPRKKTWITADFGGNSLYVSGTF